MWSYNSSSTLEGCLRSISEAIPDRNVCHRIMVDGGSKDRTKEIAEKFGWDFYTPKTRGIPHQANLALEKVDTEIYASFEHDIILAKDWFPRMTKLIGGPNVAVAQGMRLTRGSKPLEAIDRWMFERDRIAKWYYSIDNNLYRTELIREVGGYPYDCRYSVDGLLRDKVFKHGMKWLVDNDCWSSHLRTSYGSYLRHLVRVFRESNVLWDVATERQHQKLVTLFGSPIRGAQIAGETKTPSVFIAYPLMRYVKLMASTFSREYKTTMRIALDEYYKEQLTAIMSQEVTATTTGNCVFCGKRATIERPTPWGFGNLNKVFGNTIRFCSQDCVRGTVDYIARSVYREARDQGPLNPESSPLSYN
jgi:glycosyltransferase involved in cell wall biosynthesis